MKKSPRSLLRGFRCARSPQGQEQATRDIDGASQDNGTEGDVHHPAMPRLQLPLPFRLAGKVMSPPALMASHSASPSSTREIVDRSSPRRQHVGHSPIFSKVFEAAASTTKAGDISCSQSAQVHRSISALMAHLRLSLNSIPQFFLGNVKMPYMPLLPTSEFSYQFTGSSGPGGQNVNKTSTKVRLFWWPDESLSITPAQKELIKSHLAKYLVDSGAIVIEASTERSQLQNRQQAEARLQQLVAQALIPKRRRVATKPTRASKERRLAGKKHRGTQKRSRRAIDD